MARVSSKHQVTIPVAALREAGIEPGDDVDVRVTGRGSLSLSVRRSRVRRHAGIAEGLGGREELERSRDEWAR